MEHRQDDEPSLNARNRNHDQTHQRERTSLSRNRDPRSMAIAPHYSEANSNATGSSTVLKSNADYIVNSYNSGMKFKGELDEEFNEAVQKFETTSLMFELNDFEMARAFTAILEGSAFNCYLKTFHKTSPMYQEQFDAFRVKYVSKEGQQPAYSSVIAKVVTM